MTEAILEFLAEHPNSDVDTIAAGINQPKNEVAGVLASLIRAKPKLIERADRIGAGWILRYSLVDDV